MNWSYVAGFFDGEGTIGHVRRNVRTVKYRLSIGQVDFQAEVLNVMGQFLVEQGIKVHFSVDRHSKNPMLRLYICDARSMCIFLNGVLPFLIVKREKSLIALRACEQVVSRIESRKTRLKQALEMRSRGCTYSEILSKTKIKHERLILCG